MRWARCQRGENHYQLSNLMATLLPFFVFIAFAVFSVPGGLLVGADWQEETAVAGFGT